MNTSFCIVVLSLALTTLGQSQVSQEAERSEREVATRISRLATLLDPFEPANANTEYDDEHRGKLTASMREEVSKFVESSVSASADQEAIQASLRDLPPLIRCA